MSEVLRFINHFLPQGESTKTTDTFLCGCCYWFAYILSLRFQDTTIMYDEVENHFATRVGSRVYDISGDVTDKFDWHPWSEIKAYDYRLYERIMRDCVRFDG